MHARLATFESDPSTVDDAINTVRQQVESGSTPPGLEGARMLMLINRQTGNGIEFAHVTGSQSAPAGQA